MIRMEEKQKSYDIFGQTGLDEGLLLNFGTERLEFKKKFRLPKQGDEVSF